MKLDDPADFSIWAVISSEKVADFRRWMAQKLSRTEVSIQQMFGRALNAAEPIQLYSGLGWVEVAPLLENPPLFIKPGTTVISETDLFPGAGAPFCVEHQLYYRGGACPIDAGNFIK